MLSSAIFQKIQSPREPNAVSKRCVSLLRATVGTACHGMASDAVPQPLLRRVTKGAEGGINHPALTRGAALPTPPQEPAEI